MARRMRIILLGIGALVVAGILAGYVAYAGSTNPGKGNSMPEKTIEQVQEEHTDEWMAIPGVEGVAISICEDKPCILILSSVKSQQLQDKIPHTVENYPVVIKETGTFRALDRQ
jgi:hypothetical protein